MERLTNISVLLLTVLELLEWSLILGGDEWTVKAESASMWSVHHSPSKTRRRERWMQVTFWSRFSLRSPRVG
jgi:hypothetical protein